MSGERIETAGEYTPTTEDVEVYFALGLVEYSPGNGYALDVAHDGFRRWLAQVTAEAEARGAREALLSAAEALDEHEGETYQALARIYRESSGGMIGAVSVVGKWLRARAQQIGDDRG